MRLVRAVNDLFPFIVVGVTAGSLYGLAGLGLTGLTRGLFAVVFRCGAGRRNGWV